MVGAIIKASCVASSQCQAMSVFTATSVRLSYTPSKVQMVVKAINNYMSSAAKCTCQTNMQTASTYPLSIGAAATTKVVVGRTAVSTQNPMSSWIISSSHIFSCLAAVPILSDRIEDEYSAIPPKETPLPKSH